MKILGKYEKGHQEDAQEFLTGILSDLAEEAIMGQPA